MIFSVSFSLSSSSGITESNTYLTPDFEIVMPYSFLIIVTMQVKDCPFYSNTLIAPFISFLYIFKILFLFLFFINREPPNNKKKKEKFFIQDGYM